MCPWPHASPRLRLLASPPPSRERRALLRVPALAPDGSGALEAPHLAARRGVSVTRDLVPPAVADELLRQDAESLTDVAVTNLNQHIKSPLERPGRAAASRLPAPSRVPGRIAPWRAARCCLRSTGGLGPPGDMPRAGAWPERAPRTRLGQHGGGRSR